MNDSRQCAEVRVRGKAVRLAVFWMCVSTTLPLGHPHMFMDAMATFMLTDSGLAGFHVYWDFDQMNSTMILEEFDADGNGRFEQSEIEKVRRDAFEYAAKSNYFTSFAWGLESLLINRVEDFAVAVIPGGKLRYSFFVPCDLALEKIEGKEISIFFEDPTMYIAFALKKNLVQVSTNEQLSCGIRFGKVDYVDRIILTITRKDS